jgi:DNA phosphorothioation-dependent restriction protein DptG
MRNLQIIANIYTSMYVAQSSSKINAVFHFKNSRTFWFILCVCSCSVESAVEHRLSVFLFSSACEV